MFCVVLISVQCKFDSLFYFHEKRKKLNKNDVSFINLFKKGKLNKPWLQCKT